MSSIMKSLNKFPYDFTYNPTASFAESTDDTDISVASSDISIEGTEEETEETYKGTEEGIEDTDKETEQVTIEGSGDYIWEPFEFPVKKLMIKDCEPDGNCQFRSIEQALYQYNNKYTHIKLRKIIGDYINKLNDNVFQNIIDNYKIEKDNDEFIGKWDPYKIKNKQDFIKHINKLGFHFEGDDTTLNILSDVLNVDFIIINKNKSVTLKLNNKRAIIVLYYHKLKLSGHYQTIGLKSKSTVISVFNPKSLPSEITELINMGKGESPQIKSPQTKSPQTKSPKAKAKSKSKSQKTKSPKTKSPKAKSKSKSKSQKTKSPKAKSKSPKAKSKSPKTKSPKARSSNRKSKSRSQKAKSKSKSQKAKSKSSNRKSKSRK